MTFNYALKSECDDHVKNSDFLLLRNILYSCSSSNDCVTWFTNYADQGHCWALYMLTRDKFIRNGGGQLEMADDALVSSLECIMKFIIRFEQDAACWELLGYTISSDLRTGLRTKIRDWFTPMIRAKCKKNFKKALAGVEIWFNNFSDCSQGLLGDCPSYYQELLSLPTPVCVRAMLWELPQTLTYVDVEYAWITVCSDEFNLARFRDQRKKVLNQLLNEYKEIANAQKFITSLSNEPSGVMATVTNYTGAATGYVSPVLGSFIRTVFGGK